MHRIVTRNWTRISKHEARRLFDAGKDIYLLSCKMYPENMYHVPTLVNNTPDDTGDALTFNGVCRWYSYYNCQYTETGKYPAFYVHNDETEGF